MYFQLSYNYFVTVNKVVIMTVAFFLAVIAT